jgi:hypothetical protein
MLCNELESVPNEDVAFMQASSAICILGFHGESTYVWQFGSSAVCSGINISNIVSDQICNEMHNI